MAEVISDILVNVLSVLYQSFWFSFLFAIFFMFFCLYVREHGLKQAIKKWINEFKTSLEFRRFLLLIIYTVMILYRTLLNRYMWLNPLSKVLGGWWLWEDGELTTEPIENIVLFIPFMVLLLWAIRSHESTWSSGKNTILKNMKLTTVLWQSVKITFLFSFTIEFLQLFLRLGTWQLSDMFYNTLGGFIGGLIYWICYRLKHRGKIERGV